MDQQKAPPPGFYTPADAVWAKAELIVARRPNRARIVIRVLAAAGMIALLFIAGTAIYYGFQGPGQ